MYTESRENIVILNRIVIFLGVIHDTLNYKYRPSLRISV